MNKLVVLLMFATIPVVAQPMVSNGPPSDRKVIEVKHLSGARLEQAIKLLTTFLLPGDATSYPELHSVVLRGTPETTAAAEVLLKKFDMPVNSPPPPKSSGTYQLRVYVLQASSEGGNAGAIPQEIAPAVAEMRKSFTYTGYRLLETVLMQLQEYRGTQVSGLVPDPNLLDATYTAKISRLTTTEGGKVLQLSDFSFTVRRPLRTLGDKQTYGEASIETELTVRVGQKLVVGKLAVAQADTPVFLILTAEPTS